MSAEENEHERKRSLLLDAKSPSEILRLLDRDDPASLDISTLTVYRYDLKTIHCKDGVRRDTHTTSESGKRAAITHNLLYGEPYDDYVKGSFRVKDEYKSIADAHATCFAAGFHGETSAIRDRVTFTRQEAFASGVGVVFEVHAVDTACVFTVAEQRQASLGSQMGLRTSQQYHSEFRV